MRDKEPPSDWNQQYKWDRENIIRQLDELSDRVDKICDEAVKNRIDIAVIWTKVAWLSAGISVAISVIVALLLGALKILPAIIRLLQNSPK